MCLHSVPYSPSSSSASPPRPPPLSTPLLRSCVVRRNGKGQDGGPGAREEGDGDGEGQEDESGVIIEVWMAAWLDPGGLDSVHDPERRLGGSGQCGLDCPWILEVAGERV